MGTSNFEELDVYQLSERLADLVWKMVKNWESFAKETVGEQLVTSVDSIGANIAEGNGRGSIADHKRHVFIARGSLYETKHWLRRAYKRSLFTEQNQIDRLEAILNELTPKLNSFLHSLGENVDEDSIHEETDAYNAFDFPIDFHPFEESQKSSD